MTSTERESEQARHLRDGVRVVQLQTPPGPDFAKVPVATAARVAGVPEGLLHLGRAPRAEVERAQETVLRLLGSHRGR